MLGILFSWLSPLRIIGIWIDTIAFSLIDDAYNLIVTFSSGTLLKQEFVENLMDNFYVIIGIFALFRIAMLLINSMINPEKLTEKGNGISNILVNFLVMFVLLIMTPVIFKEAINLQNVIVEGNYVQKIFINADSLKGKNPGKAMRSIAIGSLITIDEEALEQYGETDENGKAISSSCSKKCNEAIEDYREMEKKGFSFSTIAKHIGVTIKNDDGETVYVYNYMFLVTFAVGCFIAYVLFSFAIDIAVRMVELTVLQILAPLFIATYIDPKSAKSGTFHNWLTTFGKTYASLFIKLAILALMLLLISIVGNLDYYASDLDLSGFEKLILLIAILIFAKKAPKWIGDMIGIKSEGLGGLGIGKKLGGMALAGGLATKGLESLKNQGKKTLDNTKKRTSNLAHRGISGIGAGNKARKQFDDNKWRKDHGYAAGDKMKLADRMRLNSAKNQAALGAASAKSAEINSDFKKANDMRMFAGIRDMYNEGAKSVDPSHTSRREAQLSNANIKAQAKLSAAGMDEVSMGKKKKDAKDLALTHDLYGNNVDVSKYNRPINSEQMNNSFTKFFDGRKPMNDDEIHLAAYAASIGATGIDSDGNIVKNGEVLVSNKDVSKNVNDFVDSANPYLKQLWTTTAYENNIQVQSDYASVSENIKASSQKLREAMVQREQFIINHPEPVKPIEPDGTSMTDEVYKNAMEKYINDCTIYNNDMTNWNSNLQVFNDTVEDARIAYNAYKDEKDKLVKAYINASGIDPTTNLIKDEPGDDTGTILVDGKYINKYGEYEIITDSDGNKAYKFVQKDMSDYYDLITQLQDKKLNGAKFKGKLEDVKKQYSVESKKVEDKK